MPSGLALSHRDSDLPGYRENLPSAQSGVRLGVPIKIPASSRSPESLRITWNDFESLSNRGAGNPNTDCALTSGFTAGHSVLGSRRVRVVKMAHRPGKCRADYSATKRKKSNAYYQAVKFKKRQAPNCY
jgi:hypothetical protein